LAAAGIENLWKTIAGTSIKSPAILPPEFIKVVLDARRKAQSRVNRIYGAANAKGRYPARFVGYSDEWNLLRRKKLTAEVLAAAHDLYIRAYDTLAHGFEISQKDHAGTRVRELFWQIMGSYLQTKFGRWFDDQVATLTEIAFELPEGTVSPTSISDARRQRSKKKKAR